MKKMKKPILPLLLLLSVLILSSNSFALEKGMLAPDFELPTLEGKKVRLSDFKGQIILLKLATTWCPTCKQQTGAISLAGKKLKQDNVTVVEVFLQDSEEMIRDHLASENIDLPKVALVDDGRVLKAYNVYLIPRMLVIDRDFKIQRDGSLISEYDLRKLVERIDGSPEQ